MATIDKLIKTVMSGTQDKNVKFADLQKLLSALGFQCRIKGDHFIYWKENIEEIINIQPEGNKAKAYQVKQVRYLILRYNMEV
ncbi:type II toxin-antitoxin system HicA family toxin [Serratia marcescens]|uniref:type II toxin-antitoxin system HicA family toxin n=1 Tax=Serratia marcescens TaxID=615 RepID=UPI0011E6FA25|nr:type II toxin-antitoxin system HicA family toxin [Serratia marcescens]